MRHSLTVSKQVIRSLHPQTSENRRLFAIVLSRWSEMHVNQEH